VGASRRLLPLTEQLPKCLLPVAGQAIFDYQMRALQTAGISDICLVLGYRREQIVSHARQGYPEVQFQQVFNSRFSETNTAYSLWVARDFWLGSDFIYLNGDVLFEAELLRRVLSAPYLATLAVEKKRCGEEEVKVIVDRHGRIERISKQLPPDECEGEFVGVARFGAAFTTPFAVALEDLHKKGLHQAYFEAALDSLAAQHPLHMVDVSDCPSIEIDFPADYERACRDIVTRFGPP
jgi:choline kinase